MALSRKQQNPSIWNSGECSELDIGMSEFTQGESMEEEKTARSAEEQQGRQILNGVRILEWY